MLSREDNDLLTRVVAPAPLGAMMRYYWIPVLLSPEVEIALAEAPGAQIPLRPGLPWPAALPPRETLRAAPVDFEKVADFVPEAVAASRDLFVR